MTDIQVLLVGVGFLLAAVWAIIAHIRLNMYSKDLDNVFGLYKDLCQDALDKKDYEYDRKYLEADLKDTKDHLYAVTGHLGLYVRHYEAGVEVVDTKVKDDD